MKMSVQDWFSQGYEKVEQRAAEIDEAMSRTYLPDYILKEEDGEQPMRFVMATPITYYEHFLQSIKRSFTCPDGGDSTKGNCPLCASGNKANFRGAYLIADHRHEEWTKDGKTQKRHNTLKVAKFGVKVLKSLGKREEALKKKGMAGGLLDVDFDVMRTGSGTDTMYNFTPVGRNEEIPTPPVPEKDAKEGKDYRALLIEAIKPKSREDLLKVLGGGGGSASGGNSGGGAARKPIDLGDGDEDVIKFS
jgi:hypothetical protein